MILDIPIRYHAHIIAPRKRIGDDHKLVATARVVIREATQAEAPVAMWWSEHVGADQVAVRSFEGDLYTPYGWGPDRTGDAATTPCPNPEVAVRSVPGAEDLEWLGLGGSPSPVGLAGLAARLVEGTVLLARGNLSTTAAPTGKRFEDVPVREVVTSTLDREREAMAGAIGHLLSVDGVMYVKASIPVLVVADDYGSRVTIKAAWSHERERKFHRGDSVARAYAVTEHDAALAAWRKARIAKKVHDHGEDEAGHDPHYTGRMPAPEIVRPDLIPVFDSQSYAVAGTARMVLERLESPYSGGYSSFPYGTPTVATYDRPLMRAYAHLRSALADGADARMLLDRLADVGAATELHGTLSALQDEIGLLVERVSESDADLDAFEDLSDLPGVP